MWGRVRRRQVVKGVGGGGPKPDKPPLPPPPQPSADLESDPDNIINVMDSPGFFKKKNLTAAASALASLKPNVTLAAKNGTLLAKLKRKIASQYGANIEAAGTAVAPPGVPTRVRTVLPNAQITATPQTAFVFGSAAQVIITGQGFSATPSDNVVGFNLGAAGTVTAATPTQLTVQLTSQPNNLVRTPGTQDRPGRAHAGAGSGCVPSTVAFPGRPLTSPPLPSPLQGPLTATVTLYGYT